MGGYLAQFIVYTIAMVGLIFAALIVYKKVAQCGAFGAKSDFLDIEESISLSPRKTLHVIRAGEERFLVASDMERTTLISKLEGKKSITSIKKAKEEEKKDAIDEIFSSVVDFPKNKKPSVIRKIVNGVTTTDIDIEIVE